MNRKSKWASFIFVVITLIVIYIAQRWLEILFDDWGWSSELRWYGSWLIAIIVIGGIADLIRKRLGIPFPPNVRR